MGPLRAASAEAHGGRIEELTVAELDRASGSFEPPSAEGSFPSLAMSTRMPTPSGFTTVGSLAVGDEVFGGDGKPCRVIDLSPVSDTPDLCLVRLSDMQLIYAGRDHQWLVASHHARSVPRTKKRQAAIDRYLSAHRDADVLEDLAASWTGRETATKEELHEITSAHGLARRFPTPVALYHAMRVTGCPKHPETRPRELSGVGKFDRVETCTLYPVGQVLTAIAASGDPRSARAEAQRLLASGDYPVEASAKVLGRLVGRSHATARDVAAKFGIKTRVGEYLQSYALPSTREASVVAYPVATALKSMATLLRERFRDAPSEAASLSLLTTGEIAASLRLRTGHANFAVRLTGPLDLPDAALPVDPYVFGAWLGDGESAGGRFTQSDNDRLLTLSDRDFLVDQIAKAGYNVTYAKGMDIGTDGLYAGLRIAGVLKNKHIPMAFLRASAAQRLAILRGLMDTDGTVDENGCCELSLSHMRLAADSLNLIRSLGIKASVSWNQPAGYTRGDGTLVRCKDRHRIHFTTTTQVFRLPRKAALVPTAVRETQGWLYITDIKPVLASDAAYKAGRCITVDSADRTFLCGDGYVVTSGARRETRASGAEAS